MNSKEVLYCLAHPVTAVKTATRQMLVGIEFSGPPVESTIEEFPSLPVSQAAELIREAPLSKERKRGGIAFEDWSLDDQQRLTKGEKPVGIPFHRNL